MRTSGSVRLRTTNSLGIVYLPAYSVLRSSLLEAGSWFRLTPSHACARAGDPCPSVTTQQQIPGLLPGTGAHRSTIDDFVRSSVLVFQRAALAWSLARCPVESNAGTKRIHSRRKTSFTRSLHAYRPSEAIYGFAPGLLHNVRIRALGTAHPRPFVESGWTTAPTPYRRTSCAMGRAGTVVGMAAPQGDPCPSPGVFHIASEPARHEGRTRALILRTRTRRRAPAPWERLPPRGQPR